MAEKVVMEKIDVTKRGNQSVELCKGEIFGARPVHHTVETGSSIDFDANVGYYHILILIEGKAVFTTDGKDYNFEEHPHFMRHIAYGSVNFTFFSKEKQNG